MSVILHSLYGRLFGTDKGGYVTGEKGIKMPQYYAGPSGSEVCVIGSSAVNAATSATTGTAIPAGGVTTLSSVATVWNLSAPKPGIDVKITSISTSTANRAVVLASGNLQSSAGSTFTTFIAQGLNYSVHLMGLSTALYGVVAHQNAIFSTSTST